MSKYMTIVSYDDEEKDIPCVICARQKRDGKYDICVGYYLDDAKELNRIVTEQDYLKEHDAKIRTDAIDEVRSKMISFRTDAIFQYGADTIEGRADAFNDLEKWLKEQNKFQNGTS